MFTILSVIVMLSILYPDNGVRVSVTEVGGASGIQGTCTAMWLPATM